MMAPRALIHVIRRDLRVGDNPIIHHLATHAGLYDLYVPVYVFPSHQIELSGLIPDGSQNPFPPAKSALGRYWRTGPHRVRFIAEAVWHLKSKHESLGSGLVIRVGNIADAVRTLAQGLVDNGQKVDIGAIWMTGHEGSEEKADEKAVEALCGELDAEWKLWVDEKYLIDDRDVKLDDISDLPDVFTSYRKAQEPLREKPRAVLPAPAKGSLPRFPESSGIPAQPAPFTIPESLEDLIEALVNPVRNFAPDVPPFPPQAVSAHPFKGGEDAGQVRLTDFINAQGMNKYKTTRNGLIGIEFSTKLSAYLAQGCITARQIHHSLLGFEDGTNINFKDVEGYGKGENDGTQAVRCELLWRDYMRLSHQKFGDKFFRLEGLKIEQSNGNGNGNDNGNDNGNTEDAVKDAPKTKEWKSPTQEQSRRGQNPPPQTVAEHLKRFNIGTTGMGLIDASQRELMHTGYTSNRARQNVASFLAKHLEIDWRYGAEWYEMLLVDYDVSSNWANWQYVSGVGNDPRSDIRIFNPVKQAFDYDKDGEYVRAWMPELSELERLENLFQVCSTSAADLQSIGLVGDPMVTQPLKRIAFVVGASPRVNKKTGLRRGRRGGPGAGRGGHPGKSSPKDADHAEHSDYSESHATGGASLNEDVRASPWFTRPPRCNDCAVVNGSNRLFPGAGTPRQYNTAPQCEGQNGQARPGFSRGGGYRGNRGMGGRGRHHGFQGKHHSNVQPQAQQTSGA